jgi:integrase
MALNTINIMASYTLRFEIRKDTKPNRKGEMPISGIVSISQQRKRISTGITLPIPNWDIVNQKAIYLNKKDCSKLFPELNHSALPMENDIKEINKNLESIRGEIADIAKGFELKKLVYSAEMIAESYKELNKPLTKREEPNTVVFDFIDQFIIDNEPTTAKGTCKAYKQLKSHLLAFINHHKGEKITFSHTDYNFFKKFENFLVEYRTSINNVTIAKQLRTFKSLLGHARRQGIEVNQGYRDFKIKQQELEVIALTEDEYAAIKNVDLKGVSRHIKARDIFIFLCSTGMRYSDYDQFDRVHIKGTTIKLTMKKTTDFVEIPLNADSSLILEKYKDLQEPLPKISRQKLSKYIKEVCVIAGINEPTEIVRYNGKEPIKKIFPKYELISTHTGRKTFCTLSIERGVDRDTVMKCSGHKSHQSFDRYVNLSRQRKIDQMNDKWGAPIIMKVG